MELEAQAFLLGIWKSFEELEDSITIEELNLILKAEAEKEDRRNRVLAAVNGIEWGKGTESAEDAVERAKQRAEAAAAGMTEEQYDLELLGIEFEVEE